VADHRRLLSSRRCSLLEPVWREHRSLLLLVGLYLSVTVPLLIAFERPFPLRLTTIPYAATWCAMTAVWLLTRWLRSPRLAKAALDPVRVAGALLVATLVVPVQITFQAMKQSIGIAVGFQFDGALHQADVFLHGQMPWMWLSWLLTRHHLLRGLDIVYLAWFAVLLTFIFWLSWTSRRALRARALVAVVLLWIGAGNIAAATMASAGPVYFREVTGMTSPYGPLLERLDAVAEEHGVLLARVNQRGLWKFSTSDVWTPFIGISAMPSLHVAAAVLITIVVWRRSPAAGLALAVFSLLTQIGSIVLAWHYAVDGYAGAAFAWLAWRVAGRMTPRGIVGESVRAGGEG
jgi:PAP2 superfamily